MAIENGTASSRGARRFKLAGRSSSAARTAAIVAVMLTAVMTLALMVPNADLHSGASAARQQLTAAGLGASLTSWTGALAGNSNSSSSSITSSSAASVTSTEDGPGAADAGDPDLPCRKSRYCSVGKLQAYVGEVDSTEGFKKMLNASCYKKECFMLTIGDNGHMFGMNFVARAWQLGLANVMLHATNNDSCAKLSQAGYSNVTCVWSERQWLRPLGDEWGIAGGVEELWAIRYILMARAVWLGYNVWLLDTDSYLYSDPYKYLTVPPLSEVQFMSLQDGGLTVNGGASYIHNAKPGGPAAWAIAYVCDRIIRVSEQWEEYARLSNVSDLSNRARHAMMDQFVLSDVVAGAFVRHPYIRFTMSEAPQLDPAVEHMVKYWDPGVSLVYPPEWINATLVPQETVGGFSFSVPYLNGTWNESIGGPRLPPRLNYSTAFIQLLEEESGLKYPDIEGVPPPDFHPTNETWTYTPAWLLAPWLRRGIDGWWDTETPQQVMFHLILVPGDIDLTRKEHVFKGSRAWQFDVAQAFTGKLFPAATPEQPMPRVMALLPGVRLRTEKAIHYRDQLLQLVRLAARLNRVALLPDPECNSTWLGGGGSRNAPPGHARGYFNDGLLLHYGLDDDQHCVWWNVIDPACMPGRYIVHPDYRELVRRLPDGTGTPGADNTVQLGSPASAPQQQQQQQQPANSGAAAGNATMSRRRLHGQGVGLAAVLEAAQAKDGPHILFLDGTPDLSSGSWPEDGEADMAWKEWVAGCGWARDPPRTQARRRRLGEGSPQAGSLALAGLRHTASERCDVELL